MVVPLFISNPLSGDIIAVAEPDFSLSISPTDVASMFVIPLPSPVITPPTNKDSDTNKEPEILLSVLTTNPLFGEICANSEPLIIFEAASVVKASDGIPYKPAPLPVNIEADTYPSTERFVLISTEFVDI